LILYRKGQPLRIRRSPAPAPPFWFRTAIAPYSARRAAPLSVDYLDLRAAAGERVEAGVCDNVTDELERSVTKVEEPVLVEAAEAAEAVYRRGAEAVAFCINQGLAALHLVSTGGALPKTFPTLVIAAWPLELEKLETLFAAARGREWGVFVPVMYPATAELETLRRLADLAHENGARFLASAAIELDPASKQLLARDDEEYALLFHGDVEPIHTATERHIAALASERGMLDFVPPPHFRERSNWNAAVVLTLAATRMLAMDHEPETAGRIARSARAVATLAKPIARIAESASLAIVETLDEVSAEILTEWLATGVSAFVERVNAQWRLRRDHGMTDDPEDERE
jgi:hypothetical protein